MPAIAPDVAAKRTPQKAPSPAILLVDQKLAYGRIPMLFMMRYKFGQADAGRNAYERFAKWSPSDGFELKAGWISASNDGGFLLIDVTDVDKLLHFCAQFKDLNESLDVVPVVDLADGIPTVMKAYTWVDSVS